MSLASHDDDKNGASAGARGKDALAARADTSPESASRMTSFVESCVETVAGSAVAVARQTRGHPHARKLLKLLTDKKNILITAHEHPDPDAFGAALSLCTL